MKFTPFWVSSALLIPQALALAASATTSTATSTTAAATCTASLITTLCSYPEPADGTAVASDGSAFCWDYCNANPPCSFVIFRLGDPDNGDGTCWLYPGDTFDASEGTTDCDDPILSVYDEPVCSTATTTATATTSTYSCAATETPSAIASVCGYPEPADCDSNCYASSGASNCMSICAKADACSYTVFNTHNEDYSPYGDGTCWVYPSGTYDAANATTCTDNVYQYVYDNECPKPSTSSSSSSSATGTAGATSGSTTSTNILSDGTDSGSNTTSASTATATSKNSASVGLSLPNPLAMGMAALAWLAL
ncbi:hypothetical protein N7466_009654 [Penicillium verhagenii]|uniref:uncharacterized protein n=1 Tax=Penicillium verhagenii TaxID=1562060 RepID=UPI00254538C7|nr:uncharacterized protein N7466_009654 [Penicillium verhagenii]KAJ5921328.1 hypothetical protein N7466_009654 [Penicillium verhagenii]